jgi:hypothetical protein
MATRPVVAILLGLVGIVFFGQGIGLIPGSAMTGQPFWAVVGAVFVVIALWLARGILTRRSGTEP